MVAVFAGLASGELVMFQQIGFGLAVAIALDATLVRTVVVPSTMALLGRLELVPARGSSGCRTSAWTRGRREGVGGFLRALPVGRRSGLRALWALRRRARDRAPRGLRAEPRATSVNGLLTRPHSRGDGGAIRCRPP